VADSWLHGAVCRQRTELWLTVDGTVCRQRPEMCLTVGYMKLYIDRELNYGLQLHENIGIHRFEMWPTVCYMNLCVDRDPNCSRFFVTVFLVTECRGSNS